MTVVYYTSTYFLDISLEIINVLKKQVDLHVFIEVTSASKKVNIVNIEHLPVEKKLVEPSVLLSAQSYRQLEPYFTGTASTHFVIHPHRSGLSFSTLQASIAVWKYMKPFKPAIIHFEGYTLRTVGMLPFLFSFKKAFLAVHDPVPHSGEKSWKIGLPNLLFFNLPYKKHFLFYSRFSRDLFVKHYPRIKEQKLLVPMCPFSYYKGLGSGDEIESEPGAILFFGRISLYKGIEVLLQAMPAVIEQFPRQKLIIAGKATEGYAFKELIPDEYKKNILIYNRYIPNEELINLIKKAKFIVCPYLDATQSGVLMTAFALNKTVIASDVGSFPEFIINNVNGLLVEPGSVASLSAKIIKALSNHFYKTLEKNVVSANTENCWEKSLENLLEAYHH
ncbi:glycosyltransferase family 4 protein [Mucilaginibacter paludis]|uniref:Glycosyl transferase group 1 n=1 Tax=Mucilaginibacter paludis DSM 18603 TaxID=714943 RepID=H1Y8U2_9SPHI|nr:glycosyltransferase family 4 protein [Mucilaginibacter paludis]EHQ28708.1 glycosyl transferase group 1 [Mucilaginibacter paludis DSM 18603]